MSFFQKKKSTVFQFGSPSEVVVAVVAEASEGCQIILFFIFHQWREAEEAEDGLSDKPSCSSSPWNRAGMRKPEKPTPAAPPPMAETEGRDDG